MIVNHTCNYNNNDTTVRKNNNNSGDGDNERISHFSPLICVW
jgi:hypothetical protein